MADAEELNHIILFGNSLGGPVAIEAALLMPGRVLGVVGVDTFQRLDYRATPEETRQRAEARMQKTPPAVAYEMFLSFGGYDSAAARRLSVPLRAINGDLYPTDVAACRAIKADFDVIIMPHMGHYPMIERPAEFNAHVDSVVAALTNLSGACAVS